MIGKIVLTVLLVVQVLLWADQLRDGWPDDVARGRAYIGLIVMTPTIYGLWAWF